MQPGLYGSAIKVSKFLHVQRFWAFEALMTPRKREKEQPWVAEPRAVKQLFQCILETKPQRGRLNGKYDGARG